MRSIRIVTHPVTLSPDCPSRDPPSAPVPCSPVILSPKITRGPPCMAGIPGRHPFRPPPRSPPPSRRATPFAGGAPVAPRLRPPRWPPPWSSGSSSPAWHPAPGCPVASSTRAPPVAARPAGCPLPPDPGSPVARRPAPLSRAGPLPSVPGSRVPHRVGLRRAPPSRRRLGRTSPPVTAVSRPPPWPRRSPPSAVSLHPLAPHPASVRWLRRPAYTVGFANRYYADTCPPARPSVLHPCHHAQQWH